MNDQEEAKQPRRRGQHVRVICQYCPDDKTILRFRHVAHVKKHHRAEYRSFMRDWGSKYPRVKRRVNNQVNMGGEQVVNVHPVNNNGEHVHPGEHVHREIPRVNMLGEHMVNRVGEHGEQPVNIPVNIPVNMMPVAVVNNGEQGVNNVGEHMDSLTKRNILRTLTSAEICEELYSRMQSGEFEGAGLDGV